MPARPERLRKIDLLNLIAGFLAPTSGSVLVYGKSGPRSRARARRVLSGSCVISLAPRSGQCPVRTTEPKGDAMNIAKAALELLHRVGLEEFQNHYPHQLSGGMKQRVAIARLLMNDPQILLMDEPFGALDALTRLQIQEYLLTIHQEFSRTVVFVTHDIDEAVYTSDRILIMSARPGRIEREITITEPRPRRREFLTTAAFLEYKRQALALLLAKIEQLGSQGGAVQ